MSEKKSKKGCLIVALIVIGVSILGMGGCFFLVGGVASEVTKSIEEEQVALAAQPVSEVQWSELEDIYSLKSEKTDLQKDELWKEYKGEKVEWTGTVTAITDTFGSLQLQLKMKESSFGGDVIVTLEKTEREKAIEFSEGDTVTFQGILNRWGSLMPISLSDGVIVK